MTSSSLNIYTDLFLLLPNLLIVTFLGIEKLYLPLTIKLHIGKYFLSFINIDNSFISFLDKKLDLILDSKNSFHLFSFSKSLYKSILSPN